MGKFLTKFREISRKDDGVSVVMWVVLGAIVVAAIIAIVIAKNMGGSKDPSTGDYTQYIGNTNSILSVQDITDAQNKFANGGTKKSDWKPAAPIIADQWTGDKNAKVIVVQYEDFACSACTAFEPSAEKIHSDYASKPVAFIYRNFSIGQTTSTLSQAGAQAAYVASGNNMNTFWDFAKLIFQGQKCVEGSSKDSCQSALDSYAKQLNLDTKKYDDLLANFATNGIQDKLNRDKNMGTAAGVNATPTWIITGPNGTKSVSGGNDADMRSAIDAAIKSAE
jgi:protein-disulfide isomerase